MKNKITLREFLKCCRFRYTNFFTSLKHLFALNETEEILRKSLGYVKGIQLKGDYVEFGVWKGCSFITAYYLAKLYNLDFMNFIALDSFEGLPTPKDFDKKMIFKKGDYSFSLKDFKERLDRKGIDMKRIEIVKGFYKNSLPKYIPKNKASVILIDSDLYSSAKDIFDNINPYIQDRTIIILDNYFYGGEKKAFEEWLDKNQKIKATKFHTYDWKGMSFIINIPQSKRKIKRGQE